MSETARPLTGQPPATALAATRLPGAFGVEIAGIDLAGALDEDARRAVRAAFAKHALLVFRDQRLDPETQLDVTRLFGPVTRVPYVQGMAGHPDVIAVIKEADETGIEVFGGDWHSDFSFLPSPPAASLLYAVEVPERGGDTSFADLRLAFEALPAARCDSLRALDAVHSGWPYGAKFRPDAARVTRSIGMTRGDPDADREYRHPVVRRHRPSGREALFVNPIYTLRIDGLAEADSEATLSELYAHATGERFTTRVSWRPGTLVVWDNRCTLHRASNDYDGQRRELHRTSTADTGGADA